MSKDIKRQLKNLKLSDVSPRPEWLKASRARLLSQISNTVPAEKPNVLDNLWLGMSVFLPQRFVFGVVRPVAVLLVVALVGTSGWIATVDASYESLPGDWLYPAKRAVEQTQVTAASFFGARNTATKLHAEFAKRRATEIRTVVKSNDPDMNAKVSGAVSDLKTEINTVNANLDEIKNTKEGGTGDVTKQVQASTEQVNSVLKEVKDDLSTGTSTENKVMAKEIGEAKDMAKDATVKAVDVLVTKHLEGDATVSKEEVAAAIDKTIQNSVSEANETKANMESVKTIVAAVTDVKEVIGVTTTAAEKIENAVARTTEAAAQTQVATAALDKAVTEVKGLVESGNLVDAMTKVKEAAETTKVLDKIQETTLNTAQSVLPTQVVTAVREQISEAAMAASASSAIKIIVTTTPGVVEPGKLPVIVIVTTTPATGTTAVQSTATTTATTTRR